jgi:hypothetical protein
VTLVGQAYRLLTSPEAPPLAETSISFNYLGSEVPPGLEEWLRVYFWNGTTWEPLPTTLNVNQNLATASTQGEGLYALMTSIEIPLSNAGWNLFAYPVQETRPVTEALLSIAGNYNTVYGYEGTDEADPWKIYGVGAPTWVNDLTQLEFGQGYWINITDTTTLYLQGAADTAGRTAGSVPNPPATYYGAVLAGDGFTPVAGMPVIARVDGNLCGQTETQIQPLDGQEQVVYPIDVLADGAGEANGCGKPGQIVTFEVGSQAMVPDAVWNNDQVWRWHLGLDPLINLTRRLYLPLITK